MARSKTSQRWLDEHFSDAYVKRAQKEGWRARAVFKLQELNDRYQLLKQGMTVIDLGAAPGSWSEYAAHVLDGRGRVIANDLLPMDRIASVEFIQGDFTEASVLQALLDSLAGQAAGLVMSDMAPNMSGVGAVDQPRAMYLAELALDLALQTQAPGGSFLVKLFQGTGFDDYLTTLRRHYKTVIVRKPKASRPRSREVYALARGFEV